MQKKYKEKIILIIDAIISQENPTLDDKERILIDKRLLGKKSLEDKEIDNILEYLKDKEYLEFCSRISYFSEAGLLGDDKTNKKGKKNFPMPFNDRYDFIKENFIVVKPDFNKLEKYKKRLQGQGKYLLHKDEDDYFYYNNQLIEMDKQNVYYKILYVIYTFSDEAGFMSYEQIDGELIKMEEEEKKTKDLKYKRIKNGISKSQGLFRFAKINGESLENKSIAGKKLIEIIKGKGLKLNNPEI